MRNTPKTNRNTVAKLKAPSTGKRRLDRLLDKLEPAAKVAIVALLQRHGQDPAVDRVRDRLGVQVKAFEDPDVLSGACGACGFEPSYENDVAFWMKSILAWQQNKTRF